MKWQFQLVKPTKAKTKKLWASVIIKAATSEEALSKLIEQIDNNTVFDYKICTLPHLSSSKPHVLLIMKQNWEWLEYKVKQPELSRI